MKQGGIVPKGYASGGYTDPNAGTNATINLGNVADAAQQLYQSQLAGNIPAMPAGPGGDKPNGFPNTPSPQPAPANPFGKRVADATQGAANDSAPSAAAQAMTPTPAPQPTPAAKKGGLIPPPKEEESENLPDQAGEKTLEAMLTPKKTKEDLDDDDDVNQNFAKGGLIKRQAFWAGGSPETHAAIQGLHDFDLMATSANNAHIAKQGVEPQTPEGDLVNAKTAEAAGNAAKARSQGNLANAQAGIQGQLGNAAGTNAAANMQNAGANMMKASKAFDYTRLPGQ
jgi:hypothetical protein